MASYNLGKVKGENGWTPQTEIEIVEGRTLRKLTGYFGGTGDEPTLDVGYYESNSGWVEDPNEATNFLGEADTTAIIGLENTKADKEDVESNIDIIFSDLTTPTTYTNLSLSNRTNVPFQYKNPTSPLNGFLNFNASGVATLPFTADTGFVATIFGTTGVLNLYVKKDELPGNSFYDAGFGFTKTANETLVRTSIKGIQLIGDWDKTKKYQVRIISRNHATSKYRIVIQEVNSAGVAVGDVYDAIEQTVTEDGAGKFTSVRFTQFKNKQVVGIIDYNVLTVGSEIILTQNNYLISQSNIQFKDFPILFANYGNPTANVDNILLQSIKGIQIIGDWEQTKNYQIRGIYRNHATLLYRILIQEVSSIGVRIGDVYDSLSFAVTETGDNTRVIFPKINNRYVILDIDYTKFTADNYVSSVGVNYNINKLFIRAIDTSVFVDDLRLTTSFYNTGLKTASANQKTILYAIKSVFLLGNWDRTVKYVIRAIARNDATEKYRIIIQVLNSDGTYPVAYAFDYEQNIVTEAGVGKVTTVLFTSQSAFADKQVLMSIDYNELPDGSFLNINGSNPYAVKSAFIFPDTLLGDNFFFKNFGKPILGTQFTLASAIKSIQLIGNWDLNEYYFVRFLQRGGTSWRIIIARLDKAGNIVDETPYQFDKSLTGVVENTTGATFMDFGWFGNKRVIAEIDWSKMTANSNISLAVTTPNYYINPKCISSISRDTYYREQPALSVSSIDFLRENSPLGLSEPNYDNLKISLSKVPKKSFLSFRTDDNSILREVVASAEKFGYRYTIGVNLANIAGGTNQEDYFRDLQAKGHELSDHTPNHNTLQSTIRNEWIPIFTKYLDDGIDKIVDLVPGVTSSVVFEKEFRIIHTDVQFGATNGFSTVAGTNRITGDFTSLRQFSDFPTTLAYIYILADNGDVKQGWNIIKTTTTGQVTISDELGIALNFATSGTITAYIIQSQGYELDGDIKVTLTENASYLLLLTGQLWFQYLGLKRPTSWIQPGGDHPWLLNERLELALDRLGMLWAETQDAQHMLTYNFADKYPTVKRTGSWWEDTPLNLDKAFQAELSLAKNKIADNIALKEIVSIASHYRWNTFTGANDAAKKLAFIEYVYAIFEFCYKNGVEFVNFSERKKLLLNAETDKTVNIMPPLWVDMNGRGEPDGYALGTGVSWVNNGLLESKSYSIDFTQSGLIFDVNGLGGIEKGTNIFSIAVKGFWDGKIEIYDEASTLLKLTNFTSASSDFAIISIDFIVPLTVNFIRIDVTSLTNTIGSITNPSIVKS